MTDTHDYPLAQVLDTGNLVHHARPAGPFGRHLETRCGLEGQRTGRDGGTWCPECVALEQAAVEVDDKSSPFRNDLRTQLVTAGTEAAEQWLTDRDKRKMSDVNRRRLAGHVVNALWTEIEHAVLETAPYFGDEQLAAATARAEKAEALVAELRTDRDHCVAREITAKIEARQLRRKITELRNAECVDTTPALSTDHGDGWSPRRPDASLDGLRGPFTGLLGPLGIGADTAPDGQAEDTVLPVADCPSPYRDGTCRHLTCGRCNEHTNNNSQGHYWAYCKVTKTKREHHFCCPGDCELEPPNIRHDDTNGTEQ